MSDDSKVNIEINGIPVQAEKGAMLIQVTDEAGIRIPRFCYHKKLSVAANCRMCLVEVEKAPKPLPACATPVMEGMKVFTRSPRAIAAQKATMEFLLINHPLDCPICDQGGECELQDVAMGYGSDVSQYGEGKRVVPDRNIGPLIATEMTRCIHCTRCVRFGEEIAGIREMGATGRGEFTRIGTYIEHSVDSEMSGNVIDLCPVGALTAKPSRYSARAWEMTQRQGVAAHDCAGSNINIHLFRNRVNRVVPHDNEAINECWLSDRDRFGYEGVNCESRLQTPMIKQDGEWRECDWETALETVVKGLQKIRSEHGAEQLGALLSPSATLEEMYLFSQLMRGTGSNNIDHRLRQADFSDQADAPSFPWLGQNISELQELDAVLLVGSNIRKEQPILSHRLRKAALKGAKVMMVNSRMFEVSYPVTHNLALSPANMVAALAAIAKAAFEQAGTAVPANVGALVNAARVEDTHREIAKNLSAGKATVLLGSQAHMHPAFAVLRALAAAIAEASGATLGYLSEGANSSGAWLAGAVPHRNAGGAAIEASGLDAAAMLVNPRKAYLLHGVEPEMDCWDGAAASAAMQAAEFVVALTPFVSEQLKAHASVMLPVAPFSETSGTFVNAAGEWQSFAGAVAPLGDTRPAWRVLRVLGNLLDLEGFEYMSSEQVRDELRDRVGEIAPDNRLQGSVTISSVQAETGLTRVSGVGIYAVDAIVRRAPALQQTADARDIAVRLNSSVAEKLGLQQAPSPQLSLELSSQQVLVRQGDASARLPLVIDNSIADGCVWIPASAEVAQLGAMVGSITLEAG